MEIEVRNWNDLAYGLGSPLDTAWAQIRDPAGDLAEISLWENFGYGSRFRRNGGYGYVRSGWGLGGWGLGSLNYRSGYLSYSIPITPPRLERLQLCSTHCSHPYNAPSLWKMIPSIHRTLYSTTQSQPFDKMTTTLPSTSPTKASCSIPDDAVLHEFRSLILFAKQDYQQSAATIHSVLAVGPGWDWTTMSGMYADVGVYTTQLRALEAFTKSNPGTLPHSFCSRTTICSADTPAAAARSMQQVVTLMPNDRVAVEILRMIAPPDAPDSADANTTAASPQPSGQSADEEVPAIDPQTLIGAWSSTRDDGSQFKLELTADETFTWMFQSKGQAAESFGGTYTVEQNVLALERKDGGSLIAEITPGDAGRFNFRLLGAADDDSGLEIRASKFYRVPPMDGDLISGN